jgi:hypothetical protein
MFENTRLDKGRLQMKEAVRLSEARMKLSRGPIS